MQSKWYKRIQILMVILLLYCTLAMLDVMVSLKFEIGDESPCISTLTGNDLCFGLVCYKVAIGVLLVTILLSIFLKRKLVKQV